MKRVMFVDDEPSVLDGLRRMLRKMRREWDMHFAESGQEALALMEKDEFDVVVSDNRMPGMTGAELLEAVRDRHPKTVRFILSGHSGEELVLKSVGPAHQYLAKPCEAELLVNSINRSCALRSLLHSERLASVAARMGSLPTLPSSYEALVAAMNNPDVGLAYLGRLVSEDAGITAKVLQVVNSAFFGLPRKIENPGEAINYLGIETVKGLVLSSGVFTAFDAAEVRDHSLEALRNHSVRVGTLARKIARHRGEPPHGADEAFTAGLLHDIGKLVLVLAARDRTDSCLELVALNGPERVAAEQSHFEADHAELGGYLLGIWGLPDAIVEAVTFHEQPSLCEASQCNPLLAVHVADRLDHASDPTPEGALPEIDDVYSSEPALAEPLEAWREIAASMVENREEPVYD